MPYQADNRPTSGRREAGKGVALDNPLVVKCSKGLIGEEQDVAVY